MIQFAAKKKILKNVQSVLNHKTYKMGTKIRKLQELQEELKQIKSKHIISEIDELKNKKIGNDLLSNISGDNYRSYEEIMNERNIVKNDIDKLNELKKQRQLSDEETKNLETLKQKNIELLKESRGIHPYPPRKPGEQPKGKGYTPAQLEIKKQVKRIKLNKRMKPQTKINKLLVLKEMI